MTARVTIGKRREREREKIGRSEREVERKGYLSMA